MSEWQRCRACGREWRSYNPKNPANLFYLLAMLPVWWFHFHFGCKRRLPEPPR